MPYRKRDAADKGVYKLPGGGFEVRWSVGGEPQWERSRDWSETDARAFRKAQLAKKTLGHAPTAPGRLKFADLVAMLKTDYAAKQNRSTPPLKHLTAAFGKCRAKAITTERVRQYEADRLAAGDARGTVNLQLAVLRRMFTLAVEAGHVAVK